MRHAKFFFNSCLKLIKTNVHDAYTCPTSFRPKSHFLLFRFMCILFFISHSSALQPHKLEVCVCIICRITISCKINCEPEATSWRNYCCINYIDERLIMKRLSWKKTDFFTSSKEFAAMSFRSKRKTRSKKVLIQNQ